MQCFTKMLVQIIHQSVYIGYHISVSSATGKHYAMAYGLYKIRPVETKKVRNLGVLKFGQFLTILFPKSRKAGILSETTLFERNIKWTSFSA